jgi:hypothetical protein
MQDHGSRQCQGQARYARRYRLAVHRLLIRSRTARTFDLRWLLAAVTRLAIDSALGFYERRIRDVDDQLDVDAG